MSMYGTLFIGIVFVTLGFVVGAVFALYIAKGFQKREARKGQRKYHRENQQNFQELVKDVEEESEESWEEPEVEFSEETEEESGLLKKRLGKQRDSWMDFECTCDGVSEKEKIKDAQKTEDDSYRKKIRK